MTEEATGKRCRARRRDGLHVRRGERHREPGTRCSAFGLGVEGVQHGAERITVWGVTGYGKGSLRLTPGEGAALESGLSMAMAASGLRGELAESVVGGFALAFKADTLWVSTASTGVEGPAGVSLSFDPTPSTPLGFTALVAPSWGGQAAAGAEALWGRETMVNLADGGIAGGDRLDAEVGYGLPVGKLTQHGIRHSTHPAVVPSVSPTGGGQRPAARAA